MSCYCTNAWNPQLEGSYYQNTNPYMNSYGAEIRRAHCSPSVLGVSMCVESVKGALGGIVTLQYKGQVIAEADFVWGEPIVLAGSKWGFGIALQAMPHRTGCIDDILARVCYKTHCSDANIPSFCLFGS